MARPVGRETTDWDEFVGRFVPVERVELRARVGGHLDAVTFTDGQLVRRGDPLFRIDQRPFQAAVAEAEGRLAGVRSQAVLANREQSRADVLLRYRAGSEATAEQRSQGAEGARAAVAGAEAALRRAQLDLEFTSIRAPQDGRIGRHLVSPGNLVSGGDATSGTLLATIVAINPIDVVFDIDQASALRYTRLAQGGGRPSSRDVANPVQLGMADEEGFPHRGHVVFVDNEADSSTGTVRLRARFDNPGEFFTSGLFARIRLLGGLPYSALLLPDAAIATDQSRRVVYVLGPDDRLTMREVRLGPLQDGMRVIREGLAPDEEVVVNGMIRARDGAPVTPQRAPPPVAPLPVAAPGPAARR